MDTLETLAWPETLNAPPGFNTKLALEDGLYAQWWSNGRLKLLVAVESRNAHRCLDLDENGASGRLRVEYWTTEYRADGMMEDFAPDDDDSEPYSATDSFEYWVSEAIRMVQGLQSCSPSDEVEAPPRPRPAIEEVLKNLQAEARDLRYRSELSSHCEFEFQISDKDAAQIANFVPLAFLCHTSPPDRRFEDYLYFDWTGCFGCGRDRLQQVEVFEETRNLVPAWKETRVCHNLLQATDLEAMPGLTPGIANPPDDPNSVCPFRILELICEWMLRCEASRGWPLPAREDFWAPAALIGAWQLAPFAGSHWDFTPQLKPWDQHATELKTARERLAELRHHLLELENLEVWPYLRPGEATLVRDFFRSKQERIREVFRAFAQGQASFPLWGTPEGKTQSLRDIWRSLAGEGLWMLPEDFPIDDPVLRSRFSNRLAAVGMALTGHADEFPLLEDYLSYQRRFSKPETEIRKQLQRILGIHRPGPTTWAWLNALLWVMDSLWPGDRASPVRLAAATGLSRLLAESGPR